MSKETTPDSNSTDNQQARPRRGGHMRIIPYRSEFSKSLAATFHHIMGRTCGEEVLPGDENFPESKYRSADLAASARNAIVTVASFILLLLQLGRYKENIGRVNKFLDNAIPFMGWALEYNKRRLEMERMPTWLRKELEASNAFISHLMQNWPVLMSIATSLQGLVPTISVTIDQAGKSVTLETPEQAVRRMLYHFAESVQELSPTPQSLAGSLSMFLPAVNAGLLTREDIGAFVGFATKALTDKQFKEQLLMAPSSTKVLPAPKKPKKGDRVPVTEPAPGQDVEPRSPVGSLSADAKATLTKMIKARGDSTAAEPAAAPVAHEVDNPEESESTTKEEAPKPLTVEEMKAKAAAIRAANGNAPGANGESDKAKPKGKAKKAKGGGSTEAEAN